MRQRIRYILLSILFHVGMSTSLFAQIHGDFTAILRSQSLTADETRVRDSRSTSSAATFSCEGSTCGIRHQQTAVCRSADAESTGRASRPVLAGHCGPSGFLTRPRPFRSAHARLASDEGVPDSVLMSTSASALSSHTPSLLWPDGSPSAAAALTDIPALPASGYLQSARSGHQLSFREYGHQRAANVAETDTVCSACLRGGAASESRFPSVRVTGFLQPDAGWIRQDAANQIAVGDVQDGADFRRARLAAVGDVADNVGYMIEFDFGFPGRPTFMDLWLEVRDTSVFSNVRVGQFRHPFGLCGMTSARELTFIERGLPFAFLPLRQIGVMSFGQNEESGTTWAVSGFRFPTDPFGGQVGDNGGYSMSTRLTDVIAEGADGSVVHLGGAFSFIDPANDLVRYRSQPEFFIAETGGASFVPAGVPAQVPPFVDTDEIATESSSLLAAELAATSGSVHGQAELIYAMVSRIGLSSVTFSGVTAQVGWILTGEHRHYNRKSGALGRIVPHHDFGHCGCGAWETAARWSILDLDSGDVRGGTLNTATLGLNWYLNGYTKFQFNYIHAFLDSPVNGDSEADMFSVRAQVDF